MAKNIIDWQPSPASYIIVACYWSLERTLVHQQHSKGEEVEEFSPKIYFIKLSKQTNKNPQLKWKIPFKYLGFFVWLLLGFFNKKELDKEDVIDSAPQWRLLAPGVIFISVC